MNRQISFPDRRLKAGCRHHEITSRASANEHFSPIDSLFFEFQTDHLRQKRVCPRRPRFRGWDGEPGGGRPPAGHWPLERRHYGRHVQRHVGGDANLILRSRRPCCGSRGFRQSGKQGPIRRVPSSGSERSRFSLTLEVMGPRVRGDEKRSFRLAQRGARTITTWRPSKRASCSTLANSATSVLILSSSLVPISWCAISRPR